MTKRIEGGVSLTKKWKDAPKQDVLDYFLQNSDFKILTDTSVSCVTYVATLHTDKESPFFSIRSDYFQKPVRNMLIKVCIHSSKPDFIKDFRNENSNKEIETMTSEIIQKEVKIQDALFRKSYIENVAEPICPSILFVQDDIFHGENLQDRYYNWIIEKLIERQPETHPNRDNYITNELFCFHPLSIIFMEFAEGYFTLFDLWNQLNTQPEGIIRLNLYLGMAMYELYRLYHKYGIVHGDIHFGNILVNPSYPYLNNQQLGKILLIDFGKSYYETPDSTKNEYDSVIYHQNTQDFVNLLANIPNKKEVLQKTYRDYDNLRKTHVQLFLDRLFLGSLNHWKEWSEQNIHYLYIGGLSSNTPKNKKIHIVKETKKRIDNNKMNDTIEFDSRIHLNPNFRITIESMNAFLADLRESVIQNEKNPPPKVEPLSPRTAEKMKKLIAEELNRPLEIEHFKNPYMYPIGNPAKVAPIIQPPSSANLKKKPKNKTKSKRDN